MKPHLTLQSEIELILMKVLQQSTGDQFLPYTTDSHKVTLKANQALQKLFVDWTEKQTPDKVDRLEVIDETGRAYVKGSIYGSPVKVKLSYQDDNRTLKVFVTPKPTKRK